MTGFHNYLRYHDGFEVFLVACLILITGLHLVFLRVTWARRSAFFRRLAKHYELQFTETNYPPWKFISVDIVRGDAPFVWRSVAGPVNGHQVLVQDIEREGALPHPWWHRTVWRGFFGISSETTISVDDQGQIIMPPRHSLFYNRFARPKDVEDTLNRLTKDPR
jgi:hypothetical protein